MTTLTAVPPDSHPLPDGGWVVLRDPATIKQRDRKALTRAIDAATKDETQGEMTVALSTVDATIALSITAWSYDTPIPSQSPGAIDDLDIPVYDALAELTKPFVAALFPNTADAGDTEDRSTPTGPSSA